MIPSLLLRPEGSYSWSPEDGVQEVVPTVGADVTEVDEVYGKGWRLEGIGSANRVRVQLDPAPEYTIIVRMRWDAPSAANIYFLQWGGPNQAVGRVGTSIATWRVGGDEFITMSGAFDESGLGRYWYGGSVSSGVKRLVGLSPETFVRASGVPNFSNSNLDLTSVSDNAVIIESILIFPEALSDVEIHRISTMPEAWTMENVSTPEMRVKHNGAVVRVAGMWTKRNGLLKETRLVG